MTEQTWPAAESPRESAAQGRHEKINREPRLTSSKQQQCTVVLPAPRKPLTTVISVTGIRITAELHVRLYCAHNELPRSFQLATVDGHKSQYLSLEACSSLDGLEGAKRTKVVAARLVRIPHYRLSRLLPCMSLKTSPATVPSGPQLRVSFRSQRSILTAACACFECSSQNERAATEATAWLGA
jgi:hypothetical protein